MGNVSFWELPNLYKGLINESYGFISLSWRGFGNSIGIPSVSGIYKDADTIMKFLLLEGYSMKDIIVLGYSMGCSPAIQVSKNYKHKGLMLVAPYRSIGSVGQRRYPIMPINHILTRETNFNNIDHIADVSLPLLIIHGDNDNSVPMQESQSLITKAVGYNERIVIPGEDHFINVETVVRHLDAFASRLN